MKKNEKDCPHLGRIIPARECATNRILNYPCPSDCPHYPFSLQNYDQLLRIEKEFGEKEFALVKERIDKELFQKVYDGFISGHLTDDEDQKFGIFGTVEYLLYHHRDSSGNRLSDLWEEAHRSELTTDERVLLQLKKASHRWTFFEVQKILSDQLVECLDYLEPEKGSFTVCDRALAKTAVRFDRFVGTLHESPQFTRLNVLVYQISPIVMGELMEEFHRRYAPLKGISSYSDFIAENWGNIIGTSIDFHDKKVDEIRESLDFAQIAITYRFKASLEEVLAILDSKPELRQEEMKESLESKGQELIRHYSWVRVGESVAIEKKMDPSFRYGGDSSGVVGGLATLRVYADRLMIETLSELKADFSKKLIEKWLGKRISFDREGKVDLLKGERSGEDETVSKEPESKIPPEILQPLIQKQIDAQLKNIMHSKMPGFNNKTPAQAVKDPQLRPQVLEMFKSQLRSLDEMNRTQSIQLKIDWVLRDLSLHELL